MKALLVGFGPQQEKYELRLRRLGCKVMPNGLLDREVSLVFIQNVKTLSEIKPYVQSLCHIFVQQHSLSASDILALYKLAGEARVVIHFSAPTLYEWCIPDLLVLLHDIKFVQVYKDYEATKALIISDLKNEILTTVKVVEARISKVEKARSIVPCDFEVLGFRTDFTNAASAYFWSGCSAFSARHELRLFGSKGMAVVDVLKRETRIKTLDGNFFTTPFLSTDESEEKELADFMSNARRNLPAFISTLEMEALCTIEEKLQQTNNG